MSGSFRKNVTLDYLKLSLILMVLGIHAPLRSGFVIGGVDVLMPFFRMAVPLFFIMSSYFFFSKIRYLSKRDSCASLSRFVKRNTSLYAFWFVILLPVTIVYRWDWWVSGGMSKGIVIFFMNFFLGGTFFASWFLSALVIDVVLIFYAARKLSNRALMAIGMGLYILSVLCSGFSHSIYEWFPSLRSLGLARAMILLLPTSFVSAFVWIIIGKVIGECGIAKWERCLKSPGLIAAFAFVYIAEMVLTKRCAGGNGGNDCYVMLPVICSLAFISFKDLRVSLPDVKWVRPMSTVFYVFHGSLFVIMDLCGWHKVVSDESGCLKFAVCVIGCAAMYMILSRLSGVRRFSWIRCAY